MPPTGLGALGYDAAAVLMEAMRNAPSLGGDAIRGALTRVKDFEGVSGKITIDPARNAQKGAVVLKIVGGKFKYEATVAP
jgi:branched-chain amino acid transport system substrate-binding protein